MQIEIKQLFDDHTKLFEYSRVFIEQNNKKNFFYYPHLLIYQPKNIIFGWKLLINAQY